MTEVSYQHPERHITEKQFYKIMSKVGDLLGINYLGTHTMRKTGAYRVYTQSNYNIGLVMHLLNHSSEAMTLAYLGLNQASTENMLNQIDFAVANGDFWYRFLMGLAQHRIDSMCKCALNSFHSV